MLTSRKASDLTYVKILHHWDVKKRLWIHQLILKVNNLDWLIKYRLSCIRCFASVLGS
jgi:hypothetical protein